MRLIKRVLGWLMALAVIATAVAGIGYLGYLRFGEYQKGLLVWLAYGLVVIVVFFIWHYISAQVRKTEKLKDEFLMVAAHRLRTPLTRIKWSLDRLSADTQGEQREAASKIKEAFADMVVLVNQLLDTTEADQASIYKGYIFGYDRLEYIVWKVKGDYAAGIKSKNITFNVVFEENLPKLYIDANRIREAMSALVENAVLYTRGGGHIDVKIETSKGGDSVVFSIQDDGIGISMDKLDNIFTRFFRTREAMAVDMDRAGLGLYIAKAIVERHGGKIGVESAGLNHGSRFWFTLPASAGPKKD